MRYKILLIVFVIIFVIVGFSYFHKDYYSSTDENNNDEIEGYSENSNLLEENSKISESEDEEQRINNILFLGIDKEENASDTIMILSLNEKNKTIKLVSIMRDTYVYQGEGMANKINYAYHYGGVQGSMNTINSVFNLDISKYVKVDFEGIVSIIDYLEGVEVNINETERKYINSICKNTNLSSSGDVTLNGEQALAFSRIRKIDSDFERTERQRKVILGIFHKIKVIDSVNYPKVIYALSKSSESNLSMLEFLELGSIISKYNDSDLSELRIPIDGTTSDFTDGVYHLNWDEEINKKALRDFIYDK